MDRQQKQKRRELKKRIAANRRFHNTWVTRIVYILIVIVLLVNVFKGQKDFSDNENRPLAQRPKLTWDGVKSGNFAKDFETAYADQFLGRDVWMTAKYNLDYMTGKREFDGIYIGKKGYLLSAPKTPDEDSVKNTVEAMNGFASKYKDIKMYALIVPDAAAIMPDMLPAKAPVSFPAPSGGCRCAPPVPASSRR